MTSIIVDTGTVKDIPVSTIHQEGCEGAPLVLYIHGYGANKEQGIFFGVQMARRGLFFVSFDAVMHGERFDPGVEKVRSGNSENVYPEQTGLDTFFLMHEVIVSTNQDVRDLITHYEPDQRVNANMVGLTGFSMGGYAVFYNLAVNPRIKAGVSIAGVPSFEERWNDVVLETSTYQKWAEALSRLSDETEARRKYLREHDPVRSMDSFPPRPLLMLSGDLDLDSPKKYMVDFYRDIRSLYHHQPRRIRLSIHDEVGHHLTGSMIQETGDWFERYLLTD